MARRNQCYDKIQENNVEKVDLEDELEPHHGYNHRLALGEVSGVTTFELGSIDVAYAVSEEGDDERVVLEDSPILICVELYSHDHRENCKEIHPCQQENQKRDRVFDALLK